MECQCVVHGTVHLAPERIDPSKPVKSLSFAEVEHTENRRLLKKYMRYGLGITNLSINNLRQEMNEVRGFLAGLKQTESENVCMLTPEQMDAYFKEEQQRAVQTQTYNNKVMCLLHFFSYLKVRGYIERIPFDEECYLKKSVTQHHNRSVSQEVTEEILSKLYRFPEEIRLMYLHLWGIGLRISEVCTLKGDAYYIQGEDAWIQVYQIKMKTYKRIPIPAALYKLMLVYLKKHRIKAEDYVFQNTKGGAYHSCTFRKKMLKACAENNIQGGEYLFKSHDYRHTIATHFYDTGVPIQSIRDYLGHDYEEMTYSISTICQRKSRRRARNISAGTASQIVWKWRWTQMENKIYLRSCRAIQRSAKPKAESLAGIPASILANSLRRKCRRKWRPIS